MSSGARRDKPPPPWPRCRPRAPHIKRTAGVAHAKVDKILNGCVLPEIYEGTGGKGESFSIYDVTRGRWHPLDSGPVATPPLLPVPNG
jgi:hypothetical protein